MYLGKIVELTDRRRLYGEPRHPYTTSLLSAIPIPDPEKERQRSRIVLAGRRPIPGEPPVGVLVPHQMPARAGVLRGARARPHTPGRRGRERGGEASTHSAACYFPVEDGQPIEEPARSTPYKVGESV